MAKNDHSIPPIRPGSYAKHGYTKHWIFNFLSGKGSSRRAAIGRRSCSVAVFFFTLYAYYLSETIFRGTMGYTHNFVRYVFPATYPCAPTAGKPPSNSGEVLFKGAH